ncbi:chemotaxis protein CheW [Siccirubricoccus sp. KC 17139]|uniref:Chemotaxis protein CheW n=1 Tax=Siccirubricoccus soli TaxID=2899147 RepID=A0ABT1DCZ4_9PROT|nr:chemotaxis protein CheW [Siccirubricoccus soli]MCO6419799.1 chemotaxis protein CheW [Siccirubricoccus soli]MCP2685934.1 chemotaxis protein CheW [Siccirubricoccus soli]
MLFLLFHLGEDPCVLDANRISEMLPCVRVRTAPGAAPGGIGAINLRGAPVPVIDPGELLLGRPAPLLLSTRIALVRDAGPGAPPLLGLVLERASETLRLDPADFVSPGFAGGGPGLGPVLAHERGLIRWIDPGALFALAGGASPAELRG